MLTSPAPTRQHAHALVERMTPLQMSAFIDLFEPMVAVEAPRLSRAPFCDELPSDAEDATSALTKPALRQGEQPPRFGPAGVHSDASELWNAAGRYRTGAPRAVVA